MKFSADNLVNNNLLSDSIEKLSINQTLKCYLEKKLSPVEVAQHFIARCEKNQHLNAFITNLYSELLQEAKLAEKRYFDKNNLPLDGIICGIKDLFCTKNIRTTAASKMLSDFIPKYESTVTKKLKQAGSIGIGKTNMDEFAMGSANNHSYFGQAFSPWGKDIVPGGSSGGSASCVSARLAHFATGSDTGGSIRQPASYTGIVGIKPTYGRCSRFGMVAFASSLDQAGVLAKNVEDAAISLQYIMGYDPFDSTSINLNAPNLSKIFETPIDQTNKKYRIGVPTKLIAQVENESIKNAINDTLKLATDMGMEIVEVDLEEIKHGLEVYYIIAPAEASSNLARYDGVRFGHITNEKIENLEDLYCKTRYEGFGKEVKRRIFIGTYVLSSKALESYYIKAQRIRRMIFNEFKNCFSQVDCLFMPTAPSPAFKASEISSQDPSELYLTDIFTIPASLAGLPAMSIPIGVDQKTKLPLGGQIIANHFEEEKMIKIARILENALNLSLEPTENLIN